MKQITVHNLDEVTEQEVFDFIAHHLLTQNKQALGINRYEGDTEEDPICCYLTEEGLRCAAGCLIPAEDYSPSIERRNWGCEYIQRRYPKTRHHMGLVKALQDIHDSFATKEWMSRLKTTASKHGLNAAILSKFPQ